MHHPVIAAVGAGIAPTLTRNLQESGLVQPLLGRREDGTVAGGCRRPFGALATRPCRSPTSTRRASRRGC